MSKIVASTSPEITAAERAHGQLSRRMAGECVVLLENDGALPLTRRGNVALFGNGARATIKGGTGSGDVNTRSNVTVEDGLNEAGYTVTTTAWLERSAAHRAAARKAYLEWVPTAAKELGTTEFLVSFSSPFLEPAPVDITPEDIAASRSDTAVYVISRNSGEGCDRRNRPGDYLLYEEEKAQLAQLGAAYEKLILVLNVGGVLDLSPVQDIPGINAVVLMSQLGNLGGHALADVLSGDVNPSGKLTDTWAKQYSDYPSSQGFSHNDGDVNDEYYTEGIYVGYRYFDSFAVEPLYPFGFGRSYTTFAIHTDSVTVEGEQVRVIVSVTNTGSVPGKEVVQLYHTAPGGALPKPYQELTAFAKTKLLSAGETETLTITFPARSMASYSEAQAAWVLEPGDYLLRVGSSSRNTAIAAALRLSEQVITVQAKNLFPLDAAMEEITAPMLRKLAVPADVPVAELNAADIPTQTIAYQGKRQPYATDKTETLTMADVKAGRCTIEELTAQLTVDELAQLCVGTLRTENGSIVGNASYLVPGAAGDTSSVVMASRGVKNMILADGPAGLRLQPVFKTDKEGRILPGGEIMGDISVPFDPQYTEENSNTYYQYCTAIPIGWALAQSWNSPMLEEIGSMVGEEMEQFGVDLWLAPAMNIHRNPLCGRNFEYFSEDPVVAGRAATAITRGVQRHAGKGTTIKHFAANSQEDNRYFTNSHISERAIREIYIKGFEIAVKESQPLSIMTSYNLLNGIHTANSYDLIQAAARDEWGFEGTVMTDWYTSQDVPEFTGGMAHIYPISASTGCVYAGNDMQMPGCQKNVDDLVEAVTAGTAVDGYAITLADLQFNAANMLRVVEKTIS